MSKPGKIEKSVIADAERSAEGPNVALRGMTVANPVEPWSEAVRGSAELHSDGDDTGGVNRTGGVRQRSSAELAVIGAVTVDKAAVSVDKPRNLEPLRCIVCSSVIQSTEWLACDYPPGSGPPPWAPPGGAFHRQHCTCTSCLTNRHRFYGYGSRGKGRPRKYCSADCRKAAERSKARERRRQQR